MRNLTVKRNKTFVGCLSKANIYIEDESASDLDICGVSCRHLGSLKSGEEKTFSVTNESARLFVIADKLSRSYSYDAYHLPEGEEDVVLSGQNRFDPATGNAFRFDGVTDSAVLESRKKSSRKGVAVLIIAVILGAVIGFLSTSDIFDLPKTFTQDGMSITLNDDFRKMDIEPFTSCYASRDVAIFTIKEDFAAFEDLGLSDLTLEEYCSFVILGSNDTEAEQKYGNGYNYFEYDFYNEAEGTTYGYYVATYKANDAFWTVQFATEKLDYAEAVDEFAAFAESVSFAE